MLALSPYLLAASLFEKVITRHLVPVLGGLEQVAHFDIDVKASRSGRLRSDPREHPVYSGA